MRRESAAMYAVAHSNICFPVRGALAIGFIDAIRLGE
jgi:hypothetical protein